MTYETKIISYTPTVSPMKLDIMAGDRFIRTIRIECTVGAVYGYEELKKYVRMLYPSLRETDFDLLPCEKPTFRN